MTSAQIEQQPDPERNVERSTMSGKAFIESLDASEVHPFAPTNGATFLERVKQIVNSDSLVNPDQQDFLIPYFRSALCDHGLYDGPARAGALMNSMRG